MRKLTVAKVKCWKRAVRRISPLCTMSWSVFPFLSTCNMSWSVLPFAFSFFLATEYFLWRPFCKLKVAKRQPFEKVSLERWSITWNTWNYHKISKKLDDECTWTSSFSWFWAELSVQSKNIWKNLWNWLSYHCKYAFYNILVQDCGEEK